MIASIWPATPSVKASLAPDLATRCRNLRPQPDSTPRSPQQIPSDFAPRSPYHPHMSGPKRGTPSSHSHTHPHTHAHPHAPTSTPTPTPSTAPSSDAPQGSSAAERNTRQRAVIREVLEEADAPLSPPEIYEAAKSRHKGLGMATVYRAVKSLVDEGWLTTVELPGESARYELAGKAHHHHFTCRKCRRVFEIHGCPGELSHLLPAGFKLETHDVVLGGLCVNCVNAA